MDYYSDALNSTVNLHFYINANIIVRNKRFEGLFALNMLQNY